MCQFVFYGAHRAHLVLGYTLPNRHVLCRHIVYASLQIQRLLHAIHSYNVVT